MANTTVNDFQPIASQEFDAARFTPAELKLMLSAVVQYINDPNVVELKESITSKITREFVWRADFRYPYESLARNGISSSPSEISLAVHSINSSPFFKFEACPSTLNLTDIPGYGGYYHNNPHKFIWNSYNSYRSGRGDVELWRDHPSANLDTPMLLNDINIELLFAFYLYHSLKERNVIMSGIPFTAPITERESEGEETSSAVHTDACRQESTT